MLPELILEIYSHLGNTDKRRLRQTCKQYEKIKFEEKEFLEEYCEDGYDIPKKYIHETNDELFVKTNRLDLIKLLNINHLCYLAAEYGNLTILKYAHENHYHWNELTCWYAAKYGHLDCLKYAHEQGCPWDNLTCECAAQHGHLACLQYAHEHGCTWDKWTCYFAEKNGHLDCLQYAQKHGS
jgi:hypothetical protein